tara:strand:- start:78 stop:203 length:126 start_codon:yes stop_codon:yes gene_type:complete
VLVFSLSLDLYGGIKTGAGGGNGNMFNAELTRLEKSRIISS